MSANILVVDDDKDIADLLEMYLTSENYTVYKFYDAENRWIYYVQNDS